MSEHRNLTGASLHEPKGAENAALDTVYVSNGSGSGAWIFPRLAGESSAAAGQVYVATGTGSGVWVTKDTPSLAGLTIKNSSIPVPLTAGSLHTPASYVEVSSQSLANFNRGAISIDPSTKEFIIAQTGYYRVTGWISISSSVLNNPIGFDILVNGVHGGVNSPVVRSKVKEADTIVTLNGMGIVLLTAGDKLSFGLASEISSTVTLYEAVFDIELVEGL